MFVKALQRFVLLFPHFLLLRLSGSIPPAVQVLKLALEFPVAREAAFVDGAADGTAGFGFVPAVHGGLNGFLLAGNGQSATTIVPVFGIGIRREAL